jgi:lipopolysaccharide assembly protein A
MRWLYLAIIILFSLAALVFVLENREIVTLSLFGFSVHAPFAVLIAVIYVLGAATGGSLFALLRRSYKGSQQRRPISP